MHRKTDACCGSDEWQRTAIGKTICKQAIGVVHYLYYLGDSPMFNSGENYFSPPFLHLSEQYLTSFHTFSHFFRQRNGLPQRVHILVGRFDFLIPLGIYVPQNV
jgi:hypothetical protein